MTLPISDENSERSDNVHTFGHLQVYFMAHHHDTMRASGEYEKSFLAACFSCQWIVCAQCVESIFMVFVLMVDLKSSLCFRCFALSLSLILASFSTLFTATSLYDICVCVCFHAVKSFAFHTLKCIKAQPHSHAQPSAIIWCLQCEKS